MTLTQKNKQTNHKTKEKNLDVAIHLQALWGKARRIVGLAGCRLVPGSLRDPVSKE